MRTALITKDFLLETEAARVLYHEFAAKMPILDYHTHLPPAEMAEDRRFGNMTQLWLAGDHYKWRAMRANGVDERFVTGDAPDREKFEKWAATVPRTVRNPLYHWTHLELKTPFGIEDRLLNPHTADLIWDECNNRLAEPEFSVCGLMKQFDVRLVCTTDDPVDDLRHHKAIAANPAVATKVLPTFRPDRALAVENPAAWNAWMDALGAAADVDVAGIDDFREAIRRRHAAFHEAGCRLADHGLEEAWADDFTEDEVRASFAKARGGGRLDEGEARRLRSAMLLDLCRLNAEAGWAQQVHIGAIRGLRTRLAEAVGPDSGGDAIGDIPLVRPLARLLDRLDREGRLARTILYNLNPSHNAAFAALAGCFNDGSVAGKVQFGAAWWFNDTLEGMERQLGALSEAGLLARFVGFPADSRSFLSFTRHEYFRRVLCNLIGGDVQRGRLPNDLWFLGNVVQDISYRNAVEYFGFRDVYVEGAHT